MATERVSTCGVAGVTFFLFIFLWTTLVSLFGLPFQVVFSLLKGRRPLGPHFCPKRLKPPRVAVGRIKQDAFCGGIALGGGGRVKKICIA